MKIKIEKSYIIKHQQKLSSKRKYYITVAVEQHENFLSFVHYSSTLIN